MAVMVRSLLKAQIFTFKILVKQEPESRKNMNIYMIRHGRQCSSLCNVNVELSEEGQKQAELLAKRLDSEFYHLQGLYSSTLLRAVSTAQAIHKQTGLPISQFPDIEEIHFGDWEGKTDAELDAQYGEQRYKHSHGLEDITYPGGENGQQCYERFTKGMKRIIEDATQHGYENIAVVTHGVAMRAFLCA